MKRFLPLLSLLLLSGCGPAVDVSQPEAGNPQSAGMMRIVVNNPADQTGTPTAKLFPLYQPLLAKNISDRLTTLRPGEYSLQLPALPPNSYRVVLQVPYRIHVAGIPLTTASRRITADFVIHQVLPASCFGFNKQQKSVMDWSSHGVYLDNREKPVSKDTCPGLFYINASWPYPLNDTGHGGSLFVPVSSECFPKTSPQTSQPGLWTFALVSPDLRSRPDWQHLQAIRFHMATRTINVSVQPEIQYTLGQQSHSSLADVEAPARYDVNGGRWNDFEYDFKLPEQAVITHVVLHVYGVPEKTVGDNVDSIFLDGVCPVK